MPSWDQLAEARIQEWMRRPPRDRTTRGPDGPVVPLETQLLEEALELAREARDLPPGPERAAVSRRGVEVETRLLILLEASGRPLAARRIAELIAEARASLPRRGALPEGK